jgi:hypothetical protein
MPFRRLVEQTKSQLWIFGSSRFTLGNDANYFTGRHPINFVTWADMVLRRNCLGKRDLIFGGYFRHN